MKANKNHIKSMRQNAGMTLVELMITSVILAVVLLVVNTVFFSSNDMYTKTNRRAGIQMNSRLGLSIMTKEIRHAGCDPTEAGIVGLVRAASDTLRVRSDMDGDGVIQTAEPSEDVTYFYDPATETVFRNPGSGPQPVVPNVTSMTLTYLDGANNPLGPLPLTPAQAAQVRAIAIGLTSEAREAGDITLNTTVTLRNP